MVTAQQLTYVSVHRASVSSFALAVDKDWQQEEPRNTDTCFTVHDDYAFMSFGTEKPSLAYKNA